MALIQEMRRLTFLISESMYEQLSEMSAKSGQTKSDFVRQSLENEIIRSEG
jgi:predicted DNA-binding protein